MRLSRFLLAAALATGVLIACSAEERLPGVSDPSSRAGSGGAAAGGQGGAAGQSDGGIDLGPFDPDATCGYQVIDARSEPAKLYFVLDRSGSMSDPVDGSGIKNKYDVVRSAVVGLVQRIGWRSEVGAALFPAKSDNPCAAGKEIFPMQAGDPKSFLDEGKPGPVAAKLSAALNVSPKGGTPTGKTLATLAPKLAALGKNSFVVLATDGGPNCNNDSGCSAGECMPNIEHFDGCDPSVNCCDPKVDPAFSPANCLDSDTTLSAVLGLAQAGVKTLVIGIPGSAAYASLLDLLAVAGGAPREGDTRYYRVDDLNELESLLLTIGSQVTVSCDVALDKQPEDPSKVNLYFDDTVVLFDEQDGWSWTDPTHVSLHGKACDDLLAGGVGAVRILVGCPTQVLN